MDDRVREASVVGMERNNVDKTLVTLRARSVCELVFLPRNRRADVKTSDGGEADEGSGCVAEHGAMCAAEGEAGVEDAESIWGDGADGAEKRASKIQTTGRKIEKRPNVEGGRRRRERRREEVGRRR